MGKKSILIKYSAFLVLFFMAVSPSWSEEYRFVGRKVIERGAVLNASLISFRGSVQIDGELRGSVLQIGGKLIVSGHIHADVIALGTDILLMDNSVIEGDCLLVGGSLEKAPSAQINGEYFFVKFGSKRVESTFLPLIWGSKTVTLIKIIKVILWMLLGLMVYSMLPKRLHAMSLLLRKGSLLKHALTGVLVASIATVLLVSLTLLSLVLVGIPFLLILLLSGTILLLVGRTVMMYAVGTFFMTRLIRQSNPILSICFGALLYGVMKFIPVAGFVVLLTVDLIGIGLVIAYLLLLRKKQ